MEVKEIQAVLEPEKKKEKVKRTFPEETGESKNKEKEDKEKKRKRKGAIITPVELDVFQRI